ncbi:hypothetical protein ANSO36C_61420 [Nostoc cf. commune SO-36]|uniref:Uncharacterized protein n=1 Tax=Nostoc cf. commune SO-36 TaxID=449208 RepID=A0ABM7ZAR7_NOSCO|nr:hypothetical protein ANSO36C_61420 [Nostoc cf. commune SO-36]
MLHLPTKRYFFNEINEIPGCSMIFAQIPFKDIKSAALKFTIEGRTDFFSAVVHLA